MKTAKPKALPEALRELLVAVREGLYGAGDDGSAEARRALVEVRMGWREVRAIYHMHTRLITSRANNAALKKKLALAEKNLARHRDDITDHNLISDRDVLLLLADVRRVLVGEPVHVKFIEITLRHVDATLKRAKRVDRRHA